MIPRYSCSNLILFFAYLLALNFLHIPLFVTSFKVSWNGESVHPMAFSKLDNDPRVQGRVQLAHTRVGWHV